MGDTNEQTMAAEDRRRHSKGHGARPGSARDIALVALVAGRRLADVAAAAGISPRTLQRWLGDPAFVNELTAARTAAFDAAMERVMAAANTAVDTLIDLVARAATVGRPTRRGA